MSTLELDLRGARDGFTYAVYSTLVLCASVLTSRGGREKLLVMDASAGQHALILLAGALPAIFFHSKKYPYLTACVLSAGTSSWGIALLLVFHSGQPWMVGVAGGLVWLAPFFLGAVAWGVPVRLILKVLELRKKDAGVGAGDGTSSK